LEVIYAMASDLLPLYKGAERVVVPGNGDVLSRVMIVGEAPGSDEDRVGEPFVGRAGGLLNAALEISDVPRESVFVTNIVKGRPPENRDPTPQEILLNLPVLEAEAEVIDPAGVLFLGRIALNGVGYKGTVSSALDLRLPLGGIWTGRWCMATYHPSYVNRGGMTKPAWYATVESFFERTENFLSRNTT
jgi:DNA polymerase